MNCFDILTFLCEVDPIDTKKFCAQCIYHILGENINFGSTSEMCKQCVHPITKHPDGIIKYDPPSNFRKKK